MIAFIYRGTISESKQVSQVRFQGPRGIECGKGGEVIPSKVSEGITGSPSSQTVFKEVDDLLESGREGEGEWNPGGKE